MTEYINREEFLKRIKPYNTSDNMDKALYYFALRKMVETPTADVKPIVHAHWIVDDKEGRKIWHCHCSNCKKDPQDCIGGTDDWWMVRLPHFCPHCGSKMDEN